MKNVLYAWAQHVVSTVTNESQDWLHPFVVATVTMLPDCFRKIKILINL